MTATVVTTGVTFAVVVVVITFYVGIKSERATKQRFNSGIARSGDTAEKSDACLG